LVFKVIRIEEENSNEFAVAVNMIRAVLFDLHGILAYVENPVSDFEISDYLFSRGYEVSLQQLKAA